MKDYTFLSDGSFAKKHEYTQAGTGTGMGTGMGMGMGTGMGIRFYNRHKKGRSG